MTITRWTSPDHTTNDLSILHNDSNPVLERKGIVLEDPIVVEHDLHTLTSDVFHGGPDSAKPDAVAYARSGALLVQASACCLDQIRQKVLQYFGSVTPTRNHETNKELRHPETGGWFLAWKRNMRAKIWFSGFPGAHKTILASAIVADLLKESSPERVVAAFNCDHKDEGLWHLPNILGAMEFPLAGQDSFGLMREYSIIIHATVSASQSPLP